MIPTNLTIEGAIGIRAGLGLQQLTIDFADMVPDDAVTVAIKGDNGRGKSTLMNLGMVPWLNPPHIVGKSADHFDGDGLRDLWWQHAGENYRSIIKYKKTKTGHQISAILYVMRGEMIEPMALPDKTISDGKVRTYNACLEHVLGPQSVYYLSAFRGQGAPRLADYDDPKQLMQDLLQLSSTEKLAGQANDVRKELQRAYDDRSAKLRNLKDLEEAAKVQAITIQELEQQAPGVKAAHAQAEESHMLAKARYEQALAGKEELEKIQNMHSAIDRRRRELEASHASTQADIESRIRSIEDQVKREEKRIQADIAASQSDKDILSQQISVKRELLSKRGAAHDAAQIIIGIDEQIGSLNKAEDEARIRNAEKEEVRACCMKLESDLQAINREGQHSRDSLTRFERQAAYVDQVPCGGAGEFASCPALKDAMQARTGAAEKVIEVEDLRKSYAQHKDRLDDAKKQLEAQGDPLGQLQKLSEERKRLSRERLDAEKLASLLPSIETAEQDIVGLEAQIETCDQRIAELQDSLIISLDQAISTRYEEIKKRDLAEERFTDSMAALKQEADALPPIPDGVLLDDTRRKMGEAQDAFTAALTALEQHTQKLVAEQVALEQAQAEINANTNFVAKSERLYSEIADWDMLRRGLLGTIDLTIEAAGPAISAYANKLLQDAYGPRFTVRIVTQRQLKNTKTVECFDISVIDSETSTESSILHKSGGETVWLDKALTDAVGLYHQDVAGIRFGALFADEAEDGLTAERKQQFYQMDRAAVELGGFARKFFVSHNPDAWTLADAVIDMDQMVAEK